MDDLFPLPIMNYAAERIESIKAGFTGAITAALVSGVTTSLIASIQTEWDNTGSDAGFTPVFQISVAGFSGFLFAVTYRYIVRDDHNSHLSSGAVMAFALVRGLAQVEATLMNDPYWLSSLKILESFLIFAIVALLLNYSIRQGWLKPFERFG